MSDVNILFVALGFAVLLVSLSIHEAAHAWTADRLGDPTARLQGRVSLNPAVHVDPIGTLLLPAIAMFSHLPIIGWAKPVPVNPRNYRNYRRGDIIVSLAGIATNLLIAALLVPAIVALGLLGSVVPAAGETISIVQLMLRIGIFINLLLAVFNLMPLPPLDGSHVIKHFLPASWAWRYQQVARYGFLILIALLMFGGPVLRTWMAPAIWLDQLAMDAVSPFMLLTPWTS